MSNVYGLRLNVLRPADGSDCTNGGVSSRHTSVTLIGTIDGFDRWATPLGADYRGPFEPSEDAPAVALQVRQVFAEKVASLVPVVYDEETGGWERPNGYMAGGSYATGDSRLSELIEAKVGHGFYGAVAIHDRME